MSAMGDYCTLNANRVRNLPRRKCSVHTTEINGHTVEIPIDPDERRASLERIGRLSLQGVSLLNADQEDAADELSGVMQDAIEAHIAKWPQDAEGSGT